MSAHRFYPVIVGLISVLAVSVSAQDVVQPEVENARNNFLGQVTANNVYVRSGPGEGFYPTQKLDRGAQVTVVGIRFDWLKIVPPEDSFCYVAKAYIDRQDDVGRVARPDLNVRAGSHLNAMKTTVQTKLNQGDQVTIVGERDEYFMIKPPKGAYLYVHSNFVEPVQAIDPVAADAPAARQREDDAAEAPVADDTTARSDDADADPIASDPIASDPIASEPVTPAAPAESAEIEFDKLEAQFAEISGQPIEQQPVAELLEAYKQIITAAGLPESMRRIGEHRVAVLKVRAEAQEHLAEVERIQEEARQRRMALEAEKEELEERLRQNEVIAYTAVGVLHTSSLQMGELTLYRLTDPANGRTVIYLRTNDPEYAARIGQFVGVRGPISTDPQIQSRVVHPEQIEIVNPMSLHRNVAAQVVPVSLLPRGSQASTVE